MTFKPFSQKHNFYQHHRSVCMKLWEISFAFGNISKYYLFEQYVFTRWWLSVNWTVDTDERWTCTLCSADDCWVNSLPFGWNNEMNDFYISSLSSFFFFLEYHTKGWFSTILRHSFWFSNTINLTRLIVFGIPISSECLVCLSLFLRHQINRNS